MRRAFRLFIILFVIPTIIGAVVMVAAGRPLLFELLQRGTSYKFPRVQWIVTKDLARWLDDSTRTPPVILDARSQAEFDVSQLKGARRMDPYRPDLAALSRMPRDTSIVVYSSAGYRGGRVADWLRGQGYTRVQNLGSSIFQWANEGRPLYRGDSPAQVVHPYDSKWGWGWLLEGEYRARVPAVEQHSFAP
jgi:rhodanese-related sulfurtransferase